MLIEFLSGFQVFLCIALVTVIYFSKPDTSGLSSLAQSFNSNSNRQIIRFRPITKLILLMVIMFFGNSLILNKLIAFRSKNSTEISIVDDVTEQENKSSEESRVD